MNESVHVKKVDEEMQVLWAEVYAPDIPDAHGDFMVADEIRKMAYNFAKDGKLGQVDINHDNKLYGCFVVETFIARKDDAVFIPDSWVVAIHVPDKDIWNMIKNGELNGLSMEVMAIGKTKEVEMELPAIVSGETEQEDGHVHKFEVYFDEKGNFRGGKTDTVDGHYHLILAGTVTEEEAGHAHRFSHVEQVLELNSET